MQFDKINNGPFTGSAPPTSIGIDVSAPALYLAGENNAWTNVTGLGGVGTEITAAATIAPKNRVVSVTGATAIETITVPPGLQPGQTVTLIPVDASGQSTGTSGNIALGSTLVQYKALVMTWNGTKWYPSY